MTTATATRTINGTTRCAIYGRGIGHLQASMVYGVVAAGCTGRTFSAGTTVIVLENNPADPESYVVALAEALGEQSTEHFTTFWPHWDANFPNKVVVNKVRFTTSAVAVPKSVVGRLTQTDIAASTRAAVIDYVNAATAARGY